MIRNAVKGSSAGSLFSLATLVAAVGLVGCHKYDDIPFNPREMGAGARVASKERVIKPQPEIPTTMQSRPSTRPSIRAAASEGIGDEIVVRLSLQEIIQRTVASNSDVAVAGYEPAIEATRVIENEARFDPTFFSSLTYSDERVFLPTSSNVSLDPFAPSSFETVAAQAGIRQNLPSGGSAELSNRLSRIRRGDGFDDDPVFGESPVNPYYVNELILRVTQPLLRDFGAEINQARITIARNNQRISVLEFRRTLEEQIATVEQAYWQLVQAAQEVRIQEDLLGETIRTADILQARAIAGADVTRVQTSQAESAVASREAVLVRARSRVADLSDEIKRRMGDPAYPTASPVLILPAVEPLLQPVQFDPAQAFDTALRNRLELGQQQIRIDSAAIAMNVAKNNVLPQLNLVGQVAFQGPGDTWGDAVEDSFDWNRPSSSIGLEFEIPFGNRLARAVLKRAQLQRSQAIEGYAQQIKVIEQDVSVSLRDVNTSWEEITKRREAVFQAKDSLLAIQQRRENDEPLTPTFVQLELDSQQTLANARAEEAGAIARYNVAIATLERAKGSLLRYNNIVMSEEQTKK